MAKLHEVIRLHSSHEFFVFEAHTPTPGDKLVINRKTGAIGHPEDVKEAYNPATTVDDIYGILGIVKLLAGPYLIVITGRRLVGRINGSEIWKVTTTKLIPFHREGKIPDWQYQDELKYRKMIECVLSIDGVYFSYTYDLTHSMQRISEMPAERKTGPLYSRLDSRFWWNRVLVQDLVNAKLDSWVVPVMMGCISKSQ